MASPAPLVAELPGVMRTTGWSDYALLDSGGGRKLERYGPYAVVRPEPQAMWAPRLPEEAWAEVMAQLDPYRTPHYSDPLIHRAVKAIGYLNLCMSERIGVERAHFLQIYGAFLQTDINRRQNEAVMEITGAHAPELMRLLAGIGRPL